MADLLLDRRGLLRSEPLAALLSLALVGLLAGTSVVFVLHPTGDAQMAIPALTGLTAVLALTVALFHFIGTERLVVEHGQLCSIRTLGPLRLQWSAQLTDIVAVEVPAKGRELMTTSWGIGYPAVVVRTTHGLRRCCFGLTPSDAREISDRIRGVLQGP